MTTPRIRVQNGSTMHENFVRQFHVYFDCGVMRANAHRKDSPYIESSTMIVDSSIWKIRAYPNGLNEKDVVLFVLMWDANCDIEADVKVNLLDQTNKIFTSLAIITKIITLKKGYKGTINGGQRILKAALFNEGSSQYIVNNQCHLILSVKLKSAASTPLMANFVDFPKTISERLFHKATSDVDIVVGGSRIPAHKLILSLVSPVFTAMFENQMQESVSNEIVISDFSEEVVRSMLRCIYDWNCVKSEVEKNPQLLLKIAKKYELTVIQNMASDHIIESISDDNVIDTLLTAYKIGHVLVKRAAMDYIILNADKFLKNARFVNTLGAQLTVELLHYTAKRIK